MTWLLPSWRPIQMLRRRSMVDGRYRSFAMISRETDLLPRAIHTTFSPM